MRNLERHGTLPMTLQGTCMCNVGFWGLLTYASGDLEAGMNANV